MPDTIVCSRCQHEVARDLWEDHRCLGAKPRLPVAGYLVRLEGDRVRVLTLGPSFFGTVLVIGSTLIDASFAVHNMGKMVAHLLRSIEEQGE